MKKLDFNYIFEHSSIAMLILKDEKIIYSNNSAAILLGFKSNKDITGKKLRDISFELQNMKQDSEKYLDQILDEVISNDEYSIDWKHTTPDGKTVYLNINITKIYYEDRDNIICCMINDITDKKNIENQVLKSEEKFRKLFERMNEGVAIQKLIYDEDRDKVTDYCILDVNPAYEEILGLKKSDIIGKSAKKIYKCEKSPFIDIYLGVTTTDKSYKFESYSEEIGRYFRVSAFSLGNDMFGTIFEDITQQKQQQEKIDYLSYHDTLTGLYNRAYYEMQLAKLDIKDHMPLSILMMDLNALKLVNDTFGHDMGDKLLKKAASALYEINLSESFSARIGGDEFICVLPNTDGEKAKMIAGQIKLRCSMLEVNALPVSLSVGIATKNFFAQNIKQTVILADQDMYENKQTEGSGIRREIIYKIIENLDNRSVFEKNHRLTVLNIALRIGEKMKLSNLQLKNLRLLAMVHDIGKISVPVEILEKPDKLTPDEFEIVKRHAEIGCRITRAVPEFSQISDEVLYHHERYDGKGYPQGIKSEDIPLLSRILTVADSYESMVSIRTYKEPMDLEDIIKEFKENNNEQFDKEIAKIMVELINSGEAKDLIYKNENDKDI